MFIPTVCIDTVSMGSGPGALGLSPDHAPIEGCWIEELQPTELRPYSKDEPRDFEVHIRGGAKIYNAPADAVLGVLLNDGVEIRLHWVCKPEGILSYCGSEFQVQAAEVVGEETEAVVGQSCRPFRRTAALHQQLRMILRARRVEAL